MTKEQDEKNKEGVDAFATGWLLGGFVIWATLELGKFFESVIIGGVFLALYGGVLAIMVSDVMKLQHRIDLWNELDEEDAVELEGTDE